MPAPVDSLFSWGAIPALEKTIRFAEKRHKILVGNIANADTPDYRRRDLDADAFDRQLEQAIDRRREQPQVGFSFDDRVLDREPRRSLVDLRILDGATDAPFGVLRHDRNDVDIEREMALLQKNAGRLRQSATLLRKHLAMLRAAITESAQ